MPGHSPSRFHYFAHGKTVAIAKVINHPVAFIERVECQEMCLREVLHMDVVANRGPVLGGVILAKNLDIGASAESHVENEWNQMRLRLMGLSPAWYRPRNVEIAQAGITQSVNAVDPGKHLLHQQLRFSIGIGGSERGILSNRGFHRLPIDRRG